MDETHDMVPAGNSLVVAGKSPRPARPWVELLLCVLGSFGSVMFPALGVAAMVYGAWLLSRKEEGRTWWAVAGCLVPGVVISVLTWDYGSLVLPCVACALVVALLLPGRIGITGVCLTIAGVTAATIMADASLVMLWGESFTAYVNALIDEMREAMVASLGGTASVAVQASVDQTIELFKKVWPLIYASRAAFMVLFGLLGLAIARRDTYQSVYVAFTRFDVPLWAVVLLIAAVACLACQVLGIAGETLGMVGVNVLICLRVLFFLQGLAVAMNLMDRRRMGPFARVLVIAAILLAELGLYATCVFGVIDVWANFRRLDRRRSQSCAGSCGEGE